MARTKTDPAQITWLVESLDLDTLKKLVREKEEKAKKDPRPVKPKLPTPPNRSSIQMRQVNLYDGMLLAELLSSVPEAHRESAVFNYSGNEYDDYGSSYYVTFSQEVVDPKYQEKVAKFEKDREAYDAKNQKYLEDLKAWRVRNGVSAKKIA